MKKSLLTTFAVLILGILSFAQQSGVQINPSFLSASMLQDSDTTVTTQLFNNTAEEISFSFPGFTDRGSGGPDAYGYTWTDSDEEGNFYTWTEISETGTEITTLMDDNRVGPFDMGFDFHTTENPVTSSGSIQTEPFFSMTSTWYLPMVSSPPTITTRQILLLPCGMT